MKARSTIVVVLLLVIAVGSYFLGYRNGQLHDNQIREARAHLNRSLHLYAIAERGDMEKLRNDLGMMIFGQTRAFEWRFGEPADANTFAEQFRRAQTIAAQVESQLVPGSSIFTNFPHTPDAKVTVGGE